MSSQPPQSSRTQSPILTPSLCFNTRTLRDFLRVSRSQLDDTINTSLNSLLTPSSSHPFDPYSTSDPSTNRRSPRSSPIPSETCSDFLTSTVFSTWRSRSRVLNYCTEVATSPDPDDPNKTAIEAENLAHAQRTIDERLDPYSGRFFPKEPRTEMLAGVLRNENAVERIVRERTWRILGERCAGNSGSGQEEAGSIQVVDDGSGKGWEDAFRRWEEQESRKKSGWRL